MALYKTGKPSSPWASLQRRRRDIIIFAAINVLYFFSYFQRVAVPGTIFNELQMDLSLSASAVALIGALYLYVYGSMQFFCGVMVDRLGPAWVLFVGGVLLSLGSLLFPLSHSLSLLYLTRCLVGLGASFMFISIVKEIDNQFSLENFAPLLSVTLMVGYAGGLAGTLPFERAVHLWGWRVSLEAIGLLCGLAVLGVGCLFRVSDRFRLTSGSYSLRSILPVLRNRSSIPVLVAGPVNFCIYYILQATIGKKLLEDCFHLNSVAAASITFVMMLTAMVTGSASGFISRWIGNRRKPILVFSTSLTLFATGFLTIGLASGIAKEGAFLCYLLLAVSSCSSPIFCCSMKELNPPDSAGTSVGLSNGLCYLAIGASSSLVGLTLDCFRKQAVITPTAMIYPSSAYAVILGGCFVLAIGSLICSCLIRETHGLCVYEKREGKF